VAQFFFGLIITLIGSTLGLKLYKWCFGTLDTVDVIENIIAWMWGLGAASILAVMIFVGVGVMAEAVIKGKIITKYRNDLRY